MADDFVVPGGQEWEIGTVEVPVSSSGTPASYNVSFYDNGAGNLPDNLIANRPQSPYSSASGTDTIALSPPVSLIPGTYWVSVQAHGTTGGISPRWFWQDRTVQSNSGAVVETPSAATCTSWIRRPSCSGNPDPDQVFRLGGTLTQLSQTLTINKSGSGSGTVSSSPAGIDCGPSCSAQFGYGTTVALAASPTNGSTFGGWSGAGCSGTGPCLLAMNGDQSVTATFTAKAPNTLIQKAKVDQPKRKATFRFKARGPHSGFQCRLTGQGKKLKRFRKCSSPKTYKKLKVGKHVFYVRASGPGGKDPTPAKKKFEIKP